MSGRFKLHTFEELPKEEMEESPCPRVQQRIFCNECGYGRSEALYANDEDQEGVPHIGRKS